MDSHLQGGASLGVDAEGQVIGIENGHLHNACIIGTRHLALLRAPQVPGSAWLTARKAWSLGYLGPYRKPTRAIDWQTQLCDALQLLSWHRTAAG